MATVLSNALSILAALLLLSVLITFHELGHFLVGKKLGFTILEFSVGMGPALLKKEKNGIVYSLRAFPIGGSCRFLGEDENESQKNGFNSHPAWKRFLTIASGPVANIIFAFLLTLVLFLAYGGILPAIYEAPDADSPAAKAGLQEGDVILAVGKEEILYYNDALTMIQNGSKEDFTLTVRRNDEILDVHVPDAFDGETNKIRLGITIVPQAVRFGFVKSFCASGIYLKNVVAEMFQFFKNLFRGQVAASDVAGPVGTIAIIQTAVRYGLESVIEMAALINISLGLMNLLPIPALDGGRLFFILIEIIRGKPVPREKEGMVHFIGLILLFGFMIFISFNDIRNLLAR